MCKSNTTWRTDEPPVGKELELLCVLFDEPEYRTLQKSWGRWNRTVYKGKWNGCHFIGYTGHQSGDPFLSVVAWRSLEEDMGEAYYPKCLGTLLDGV